MSLTGKTDFAPSAPSAHRGFLNSQYFYPGAIGDVRYVSSGLGASTGPGWTLESAYATLNQAIGAATASNGDVILVAPGHAETIVGAAGWSANKAGVRIQGLGIGRNRPTFTFSTSTAAQVLVSASNVTLSNLVFDFTGVDAIVAAISVTGADVAFEDCEFITNSATAGAVLGILTAATASRFRLSRCRFIGAKTNSGTTTTAQVKHEIGEDFVIEDCHFEGKMTQAILNATAIINGLIKNCTIHTYTGTKAIAAHNSSQFLITNCRMCVASGTAPITGTVVNVCGNQYTTEGVGFTGSAVTI